MDEFYRETWIEVQLDAISSNVKNMYNHLPNDTDLMVAVKANGYGHGAYETATIALESGATALATALLDEAIYLRKQGITAPILVLGYVPPNYAQIAADYNISLTVFQKEWVDTAKTVLTSSLPVHIKCDTGMGRLGVRTVRELEELLNSVKRNEFFHLEGIFTHFAAADEQNSSYYLQQLRKFQSFLEIVKEKPRWIHASNSAASLRFADGLFDLVRSGISTYGLTPSIDIVSELPFPLQPALSLHTRLTHVKKVAKGAKISYGGTYTAKEDEWIGTIPIGYADGWLRLLQGQSVLIDGIRVPIVGRICMDQCMIKLPQKYPVGSLVTLIGNQGEEHITVNEIAEKLGTINYEVICILSHRLPRVYKKGKKIVQIKNELFR
ncbi:alanine racemase [Bacillus kwashiorkori]|uniref:alanine racemase n=1 Tax=Bacillus kwashiorkori TaxID=1522318 RepID=UPI0007806B2D|nr:alanine racemase [Bacillus kwashiorkori]